MLSTDYTCDLELRLTYFSPLSFHSYLQFSRYIYDRYILYIREHNYVVIQTTCPRQNSCSNYCSCHALSIYALIVEYSTLSINLIMIYLSFQAKFSKSSTYGLQFGASHRCILNTRQIGYSLHNVTLWCFMPFNQGIIFHCCCTFEIAK